mmetsp:Transcript_82226/g.208954  ORF Transcript_82226/g.208954 Transcript_82226/m.208954 type:complete len:201 (+) Transcript_82226:1792-2394(+)
MLNIMVDVSAASLAPGALTGMVFLALPRALTGTSGPSTAPPSCIAATGGTLADFLTPPLSCTADCGPSSGSRPKQLERRDEKLLPEASSTLMGISIPGTDRDATARRGVSEPAVSCGPEAALCTGGSREPADRDADLPLADTTGALRRDGGGAPAAKAELAEPVAPAVAAAAAASAAFASEPLNPSPLAEDAALALAAGE